MVGDGLGEAEVETDGEALGEAEEVALAEGEALAEGGALAEPDTLGVEDGEAASPGSWGISKVAQTVRKTKVFLKVHRLGLIT